MQTIFVVAGEVPPTPCCTKEHAEALAAEYVAEGHLVPEVFEEEAGRYGSTFCGYCGVDID